MDSGSDRWNGAALRGNTGQSDKDVVEEVDIRVRFPINKYVATNLGYAKFWAGNFTKATSQRADPQRRENSDFFIQKFRLVLFN